MESLSTTVLGTDFHTEGTEQRKARFASVVLDDVPQGSVLGSLLFAVYYSPVADVIARSPSL